MQTLLIVLMAGCALVAALHIGRGIWARSRSVERHQHALDTLARFTAPVDAAPGAHAEPGDHQAHVRVIGRNGRVPAGNSGALPPPREPNLPGPVRTSPFRRPSHLEPSVAAMDAATSVRLSTRSSLGVFRAGLPPPAGPSPSHAQEQATVPGMPPIRFEGPATRPVPVVQPQVFYFDDVAPGAGAALKGEPRRRPSMVRPLVVAAVSVAVAGVAIGVELVGPAHRSALASRTASPPRRASPPPAGAATGRVPGTATAATTVRPPTTVTTPTTPRRPATTPSSRPAVLLSTNGGTATYQLTSPTASIEVRATGPCWIEVKAGSHFGQVVYEATLQAGQGSTVTGPAWIRLGDPPHVAVSVDGTPMTVPGAATAVPLDLQFTLG